MSNMDKQGRAYVRRRDLRENLTVWLDGGFPCVAPGPAQVQRREVLRPHRPWSINTILRVVFGPRYSYGVQCRDGFHDLDGQDDGDGYLVGVYAKNPGPLTWQAGQ